MANGTPRVQILRADDWVGIYVDGRLKREGHSHQEEDVIKVVTGELPATTWVMNTEWWDEVGGSCPEEWTDVRKALVAGGQAEGKYNG